MREKEPVGFEPGVTLLEDIWKEESKFSLDIEIVLNKTPKCNIKARIQSQYIITVTPPNQTAETSEGCRDLIEYHNIEYKWNITLFITMH